jgi:hypothetical protein
MRSLLVVGLLLLAAPAHAQPSAALGKPLPSADLPAGTITVRVIDGDPTRPLAGVKIMLVVDGAPRYATTTTEGRAEFVGVPAGARVKASYEKVASAEFVVPDKGGTRVMLSTGRLPDLPEPRSTAIADEAISDGAIVVHVVYGDFADPKPPSGIAVTLVGYAADDTITAVTRTTDARGRVTFDQLDRTSATAYHVMALLPRGGKTDRVVVPSVVMPAAGGMRVALAAAKRTAKIAPVDDLAKVTRQDALPAGKMRIKLVGMADPKATIDLVDAANGKLITHAPVTGDHVDVAAPSTAGRVLYAETMYSGQRYRSLPFQPVAHAGTTAEIFILPRMLSSYQVFVRADDPDLEIAAKLELANNAWAPYVLTDEIPLPRGFTQPDVDDTDATLTATGIRVRRPLPPGGTSIRVSFRLPAHKGVATWSLDLPFGAYQSSVSVTKEPGVTVQAPPTVSVNTRTLEGGDYYTIEDISILPHQSMTFAVTVPVLPPLERTCRKLRPDHTALEGKAAPPLPAADLDGKKLPAKALVGKTSVVTFNASWNGIGKSEPATLDKLVKAVPGVAAVLVYSDTNPDEVRPLIDPKAGYHVVLDPPIDDQNIGPITQAWGTNLVPESYLVDRKGIVRYYIVNERDWSSPEAIACVRALDRASP